ncbi:MAG: VWA domain-containing protein [Bacteroidetes bacterium]|nr:VWA domain-containing protein [Bacteroidota bacterium]
MPYYRHFFVALLFLFPVLSQAQLALHIDTIDVSAYPDIQMIVRVTDGNDYVRGMQITDFTVFEDGFVQPITGGYCQDTLTRGPVSVLLLIDVSRSMGAWPWGNNAITPAKRAAKSFVDRMSDEDELALVSFSTQVYYNQPWTNDRELIKQRIDQLNVIRGTALWDGVYLSSDLIAPRTKKKVIILLADGQDGASTRSANDAIQRAVDADCVVYTIGLGNDVDVQNMTLLATETGGRYYHAPEADDLDEIYLEIIQQLETTGVCYIDYRSPIDCWNGDIVSVEVEATTSMGPVRGTVEYQLPYDTTTFSYVRVSMDREHVVEAGEEITIPLDLTRVSLNRAPSRFSFSLEYDNGLLQLQDISVAGVAEGFNISTTETMRGSDVTIVGGNTITSTGALCDITFRAAPVSDSKKVEISVSEPDVQQFCTVASSDNGLITISGTCERALHQGAGLLSRTRIISCVPNPFPASPLITYHIGMEESVRLSVFDLMGREVSVLVDGYMPTGTHTVNYDSGDLPSGILILVLETPTVKETMKLTLSR